MKIIKTITLITSGFGFSATSASASGHLAAGEKVFKKCEACYEVESEKHKTGPHLINIMSRIAGSVDGYKRYSDTMKSIGIVWNEETLDGYLEKLFKISCKMSRLLRHGDVDFFCPVISEIRWDAGGPCV